MLKLGLHIRRTAKCVDCGFLGYRWGRTDIAGVTTLEGNFGECHADSRQSLHSGDSYIYFAEDGESWTVVGCFHRVWSLGGFGGETEREKAKKLVTESRGCKYYFPYQSGYEPAGHNEMRRDKKNQSMMLWVGLINAAAVVLAAAATVLFRG
ncbi:MAG: hypothetical protein KJ624_02085 [Chloroflexi bacterium]|nr:hypothetical protein [Chloroflexota bacterium]